jgi:hypothetical protein
MEVPSSNVGAIAKVSAVDLVSVLMLVGFLLKAAICFLRRNFISHVPDFIVLRLPLLVFRHVACQTVPLRIGRTEGKEELGDKTPLNVC